MALSNKQQVFVEHYLQCWNATRAAELAGYKHPNKQGPRLLVNVGIAAAIQDRVRDVAMSADEVLARYSAMGRGDLTAFLGLSEDELKRHPQSFLVKKFKRTDRRIGKDTETTLEVELYDAQAALAQLGKYHRLFVDRIEVDWRTEIEQAGLNPDAAIDALTEEFVAHLRAGAERADPGSLDASESGD